MQGTVKFWIRTIKKAATCSHRPRIIRKGREVRAPFTYRNLVCDAWQDPLLFLSWLVDIGGSALVSNNIEVVWWVVSVAEAQTSVSLFCKLSLESNNRNLALSGHGSQWRRERKNAKKGKGLSGVLAWRFGVKTDFDKAVDYHGSQNREPETQEMSAIANSDRNVRV
jgi:hypothetical protein